MEDNTTSCFTKAYSTYFKGTGSVLLFPDERTSRNDVNTDSSVEQMKATATTTILDAKTTNLIKEPEQETDPVIPSSVSAVSAFQQTPSTRKFDADWKTSLQVTSNPTVPAPSTLALIFPTTRTGSSITILCA